MGHLSRTLHSELSLIGVPESDMGSLQLDYMKTGRKSHTNSYSTVSYGSSTNTHTESYSLSPAKDPYRHEDFSIS